jgi:folate-binding protein YgfZ
LAAKSNGGLRGGLETMETESALAEAHRAEGAVLGTYFGCTLPARFSSVEAEYRAAHESAILADTNFHAVFRFEGPDRARYLNAVLTSNVRDLTPGQGTVGLLLNAQGHILAEIETLCLADSILAISHASVGAATFAHLEKFIIMDDVTLTDLTASTGSLEMAGPRAAELLLARTGVDLNAMAVHSHVESKLGAIPCRIVRLPWPGVNLFVAREHLAEVWTVLREAVSAAGGRPIGWEAANVLRLEAGRPWFGVDYDEKQIPHEAGVEISHISYTKGCYTGQEIVERVRSRGQVNRRRVGLRFDGAAVPQAGEKLLADGAEVGNITSAAYSFAVGAPIGFGYLRREHNTPGRQLQWSGGTAEVVDLPLAKK